MDKSPACGATRIMMGGPETFRTDLHPDDARHMLDLLLDEHDPSCCWVLWAAFAAAARTTTTTTTVAA